MKLKKIPFDTLIDHKIPEIDNLDISDIPSNVNFLSKNSVWKKTNKTVNSELYAENNT
jgi:hypothetical protein